MKENNITKTLEDLLAKTNENLKVEGLSTEEIISIQDKQKAYQQVMEEYSTIEKEFKEMEEENKILRGRLIDNIKYQGNEKQEEEGKALSLDEQIDKMFKK